MFELLCVWLTNAVSCVRSLWARVHSKQMLGYNNVRRPALVLYTRPFHERPVEIDRLKIEISAG